MTDDRDTVDLRDAIAVALIDAVEAKSDPTFGRDADAVLKAINAFYAERGLAVVRVGDAEPFDEGYVKFEQHDGRMEVTFHDAERADNNQESKGGKL